MQYTSLHLSEEEGELERVRLLSVQTIAAMKRGDQRIQDTMRKRRGRKKFILSDEGAKRRLKKRQLKALEKRSAGELLREIQGEVDRIEKALRQEGAKRVTRAQRRGRTLVLAKRRC